MPFTDDMNTPERREIRRAQIRYPILNWGLDPSTAKVMFIMGADGGEKDVADYVAAGYRKENLIGVNHSPRNLPSNTVVPCLIGDLCELLLQRRTHVDVIDADICGDHNMAAQILRVAQSVADIAMVTVCDRNTERIGHRDRIALAIERAFDVSPNRFRHANVGFNFAKKGWFGMSFGVTELHPKPRIPCPKMPPQIKPASKQRRPRGYWNARVDSLRSLHSCGYAIRELADLYGTSYTHMWMLITHGSSNPYRRRA